MPPHGAGFHLRLQERRGPAHERFEGQRHLRRRRRTQPGDFPEQSQQLRLARGQPEDRAHHGFDPVPALAGLTAAPIPAQSDRSSALLAMTASRIASLEGNQYRMLCLVSSSPLARASRDVAS